MRASNPAGNESLATLKAEFIERWHEGDVTSDELFDEFAERLTLQLGRDCLKLGIVPFLTGLVGEVNVNYLFERHAGEIPDEPPHRYDSFGHPCRVDCGVVHG